MSVKQFVNPTSFLKLQYKPDWKPDYLSQDHGCICYIALPSQCAGLQFGQVFLQVWWSDGKKGWQKFSPNTLQLRCTTAHICLDKLCAPWHTHVVLLLGAGKGYSIESTLTLGHLSVSEPRNCTCLTLLTVNLEQSWSHWDLSFSAVVLKQVFSLKDTKFKQHCFSLTVHSTCCIS